MAIVVAFALSVPSKAIGRAPAESRTVAVPPIQIQGTLESHWRQLLSGRLIRRLKGSVEIVEPEVVARKAGEEHCTSAACFRRIAHATGADFVLTAEVEVTDNDYLVVVRLIDGETGQAVASGEDRCELCGVAEVGDLLADQTFILRQKVEAMANAPPLLRVTSVPKGALVYLDGELVGKTPLQRTVEAGAHEVRAEKAGYISGVASVITSPGDEHDQKLSLVPVPRIQRAKPWAWGMLGAGGLGVTAGVTLLVLDGRQYRPRCSDENVDDAGNCRFRYGTRTPGIVFTAIGAATILAAAIILAVARSRRVEQRKGSSR